ncbi:glycogen/starch/alpha-glucan phosphorylase [Pseudaestuariivita atlantica]|uniref:Alpha-1,4 glucan phosphorylase n=1 Tax=Pseudaestuariivita atlantica TaxID=1317121 RepID=A0A0L1JK93_9RHOB|nr:glycogen/starch/alpha-glucan phosphorylase [Pseudaestuariivita atlantica]KNG92166.1 maltodextrin phosphorylase [Pseudaestuariivita atlantica]
MARDLVNTNGSFSTEVERHLQTRQGVSPGEARLDDWWRALALAVRDRATAGASPARLAEAKEVNYLSMEFLIGRVLEDALTNLHLTDETRALMDRHGADYDAVLRAEPDAALGNGGLGRLAACFLESLSTLGCPAYGYGILYEHGLFKQSFDEDGRQAEAPETWLTDGSPWALRRMARRQTIGFGGTASDAGWYPADAVIAEPSDLPVIGWDGAWTNTLRLFSARPVQPFDLARFNAGDYAGAAEEEALARTISRVLYPDDTTPEGQELRLKQEFFFTAAALRDILARFEERGHALATLPDKVAIQLNDTHPAVAAPELVRLLTDERGMAFDDALALAQKTLNYTNHTLLPEALERWDEGLFGRLLPRHLDIVDRIDAAHARAHPKRKVAARADGAVQMGVLSFIAANRVNGVSALHTELMKETVFADLNALHPGRILNQTNGVTPRRWMQTCNPRLAGLITGAIGDGWVADLDQLQGLEPHLEDAGFAEALAGVKRANKVDLAGWMAAEHGVKADPAMMFDVQIKRIHEYKRQHLNILETIALWQAIKDAPNGDWTPRLKLFGGKAAPGYVFAKEIIHLINSVAKVVNADPVTRDVLQVAYLPNYNVSMAERLIPAADLSEQISTAGKEASGTGNMKFALNGAPTMGTLDGANVEIRERVGAENFFLFGMTADEVVRRRAVAGHAAKAVKADARLAAAIRAVRAGMFGAGFDAIVDNLTGPDYFLVSSDFTDYWRAQREADRVYADDAGWTRMAGLNIARSGWFSSDRTIRGYMADIWGAESLFD